MWPFDIKIKKLEAENKRLKDVILSFYGSSVKKYPSWDMYEKLEELETENKKLREQLDVMWNEAYSTKLPHPSSDKSWYDLRIENLDKDREIETLKRILEFSEADQIEWEGHKKIFSFFVKKQNEFKEKILALEEENNRLMDGKIDKKEVE